MFLNDAKRELQKTFDLERRTAQKIVLSSLFGNRFSLKISLSLFLSQKLSMNIRKTFVIQQPIGISSWAKAKI